MFKSVLIANRGEIAVRIIKACQELGIHTIAIYSDVDAQAPHVTIADEAVNLGDPTPIESYLNIPKIIQIAKEKQADAIHPGYGFLAENPDFAQTCNKAGIKFIGPSPEVISLMGDKIAAKKTMENLFKTGKLTNYETKFKTKSNQEVDTNISASLVKDKIGQNCGAILIGRDITEKKQMEEQLIKSERLAAIGQAATMVGHDLRNPLQAIENGVYLLNAELSKNRMTNTTKTTIDAITKSIEYADNIVNNLRSFTKMEKPMLVETDINSVVKESLSLVNKPDNIELVIKTEEMPKIKVDKKMLKRVFVNLATNGMQAMKEKNGTLTVTTKKNGEFAEVSFKDTGVGISKEGMKKLFTPFFTTKAQGMGVGLALCKKFVELNKGTIDVESEQDKGSKFTIKLNINN